jgi:hypothetical protein
MMECTFAVTAMWYRCNQYSFAALSGMAELLCFAQCLGRINKKCLPASECLYRIDPGRPESGQPAGDQLGAGQECGRHPEDQRVERAYIEENASHHPRNEDGQRQAERQTSARQDHAFSQKESHHRSAVCAEGHADAYLRSTTPSWRNYRGAPMDLRSASSIRN